MPTTFTISPPNFLHFSAVWRRVSSEGTPWKKWHERIMVVPNSLQALLRRFPISLGASISRSTKAAPASIAFLSLASASSHVPLPSPATRQVAIKGVSELENSSSIPSKSSGHRSSRISAIWIVGELFSRRSKISSRERF